MTIPISDQIAEVEREIRQRERLYPKWIEAGRLRQDTAATKLAQLRAAAQSLRFMAQNRDWIEAVWRQRKTLQDVANDEADFSGARRLRGDAQPAAGRELPSEGTALQRSGPAGSAVAAPANPDPLSPAQRRIADTVAGVFPGTTVLSTRSSA